MHGGVLLLVKLQASACNFTKSNTPPSFCLKRHSHECSPADKYMFKVVNKKTSVMNALKTSGKLK